MSQLSLDKSISTSTLVEVDEFAREARRMEEYGGEDPHEPTGKDERRALQPAGTDKSDLNRVGWDGPDDPENPQSWSNSYKWFLTFCAWS
ncbi:hypothetical protein B0H21DRAFT_550859 [Amylocystis lapponica]|nr:hypothetical protein B0H21DRAFT_550859 [Amylocystis lapponica]